MEKNYLANTLLPWYRMHGRHHLPWQQIITPYRTWISEVMLQQTQVKTVIPYFQRFMEVFPTVEKLADAPLDEVLSLWSGLGYYARARNIHRSAQIVVRQFKSQFPNSLAGLQQLPGIGRSTAGAILSIAFNQPAAILDGNVKRVLARFHTIGGSLTQSQVIKKLWRLAQYYIPQSNCAAYSQAIMDLGATLCLKHQPNCINCPLKMACKAYQMNRVIDFPKVYSRKTLPNHHTYFLILQNKNKILLEKRPPTGIWGGLWSFPQCPKTADIKDWSHKYYGLKYQDNPVILPTFRHTFTHFHLHIYPRLIQINSKDFEDIKIANPNLVMWIQLQTSYAIGLPKPVKILLQQLAKLTTKN